MRYLLMLLLSFIPVITSGEIASYDSYAAKMEIKYNVPAGLVQRICLKESGWQNVRGSHGEIGVCQIKPDTVRHAFGDQSFLSKDHPMLANGVSGKHVKMLTALLFEHGYEVTVGPYFDDSITDAVIAYQQDHHLKPDGIVGPRTWGSLLEHPSIEEQLWNPNTNIEYAAKYLQWLGKSLNTREPMILAAAYNSGPGNGVVKYMLNIAGD